VVLTFFEHDELLRHIFDFAAHFVDLQERGNLGLTPFLSACMAGNETLDPENSFESLRNIKVLSLFLENGASVHDRDVHGATCLHQVFINQNKPPSEEDWHDSLKFLIDKGADVYAEDYRGRSVSHVAYSGSCWDDDCGSYRGDLWDAVLDACGYDIREFRKGYPRIAAYGARYTRSDFEALWKDREDRCPYWDDAVWSSPLGEEGIKDKTEFICCCFRGRHRVKLHSDVECTDESSDTELDSDQSDEDEEEEDEASEDDGEGEESSCEEDQEDQEDEGDQGDDTPRERLLPSQEWMLERDPPLTPSCSFESELPDALSAGVGEASSWVPNEAAQAYSWDRAVEYGGALDNPWLDNEL